MCFTLVLTQRSKKLPAAGMNGASTSTKRIKKLPAAGMDVAASTPPKHEMRSSTRHIPPDILEEILLLLPVKSLVRFCCVSKFWKSMISESRFVRKLLSRATLHQKRVVISDDHPLSFRIHTAFWSPLSRMSNQSDHAETNFICPFLAEVELKAYCKELWCIDINESLYLWNPSIRIYRKLSDPPRVVSNLCYVNAVYGLGYDSVNDDYKLLKVWRINRYEQGTLLYSLRSDSWMETHNNFPGNSFPNSNCEFVNGAFHWMVLEHEDRRVVYAPLSATIISFDLLTQRYREVPQPEYSPWPNSADNVEVAVLREMMCVFLNYRDNAFVLWAMRDYGVQESWIKMYDVRFNTINSIRQKVWAGKLVKLKPLYLYENGEVLIWMCDGHKDWEMFIYQYDQVVAKWEIVASGSESAIPEEDGRRCSHVHSGFVYVESLVSPAKWPKIGSVDDA